MRKLLAVAVTLSAIAWSGAAWAITVDTTPKTPAGPETPGTSLHVTLKDEKGHTVATHTVKVDKGGHAKVDIPDEEKKKSKTVVITSTDKGKNYKTEVGIDVFMQGGEIALTAVGGGALRQIALAEHNPAPEPVQSVTTFDNRFRLEFGFGGVWNSIKTNASDFGPGLGGTTNFSHTNSDGSIYLSAGALWPVFNNVSVGPVVTWLSGDLNPGSVSMVTPAGIVGTSQISRGWAFDVQGRLVIYSVYGLNVFAEGGAEFASYTGSMVNSGVEAFQNSTTVTSPIVGGGFQVPLCGVFATRMNNGVCPLMAAVEYNHVFVNTNFFTGLTPLSKAQAGINGENRVMAGFDFEDPFGYAPNAGRPPNLGDLFDIW